MTPWCLFWSCLSQGSDVLLECKCHPIYPPVKTSGKENCLSYDFLSCSNTNTPPHIRWRGNPLTPWYVLKHTLNSKQFNFQQFQLVRCGCRRTSNSHERWGYHANPENDQKRWCYWKTKLNLHFFRCSGEMSWWYHIAVLFLELTMHA